MRGVALGMALVLFVAVAAAGAPETWRFSNGAEFPGAKGSLETDTDGVAHLRYDFTGGGNYVGAYRDLDPPQPLSAVAFRIKKPAEAQITLRVIDSTDQGLQEPVVYDHGDWQRVEVDMMAFDAHWGGANDGVLHPPVKSVGILVESGGLESPVGEVLLSDVRFLGGGDAAAPGDFRGTYRVVNLGRAGEPEGPSFEHAEGDLDFRETDTATLRDPLSLLGNPRRLTVTIRGGAPGNVVKVFLGSHFQGFSKTVGTLDGQEKSFTVDLPPGNGWDHFGGENDGEVRLPLRLEAIAVERGDGPKAVSRFELVEVTCETVVASDQAVSGLATLGDGGEARCTAWNVFDKDIAGTMTVTLRDWESNEIGRVSFEQTLPANGRPVRLARRFDVPADRNFAEAEFAFEAEEARFSTKACWARPVSDAGDAALRPESPWGMGVYLYRYPDPAQGSNEMERAAALAQAAGVKWSREEFSWARTEPRQGEFDFAFYDSVVDTARRHGISVYGLLSYWSDWTDAYTEKGIDDFCVWAKAVVGHFKDRVKHWEIYNEPNIFFWSGPKELYPVLVKKCYAAIKEADPEATVLAISTAGIDLKFIDRCLQADAPFDVLTIHPYRGYLSEKGFMNELRGVADRVGKRPVWITEMGWSTHVGGVGEREQAGLLARCYLAAVASGACRNISWYDFRNDGTDPFYNESNFGVLRNDLAPKPAYRALATLCRTMQSGAPQRRDEFGDGVYALQMGEALAVWAPRQGCELPCRLGGDARVVNLMGEALDPPQKDGVATLTLRAGRPVFVSGGTCTPAGAPVPVGGPAVESGVLKF